jgi:hypothetical protein
MVPGKNATGAKDAAQTSYSIINENLAVGGMTSFFYMKEDGVKVDAWFHCAKEEEPPTDFAEETHWVKLDDGVLFDAQRERAEEAAARAAQCIRDGKTVLISCMGGENRSGLVAALALIRLGEHQPVKVLCEKRGSFMLNNLSFRGYVNDCALAAGKEG